MTDVDYEALEMRAAPHRLEEVVRLASIISGRLAEMGPRDRTATVKMSRGFARMALQQLNRAIEAALSEEIRP